jgi:RNA polymerase sigma-70 factor (ECF subfamily)
MHSASYNPAASVPSLPRSSIQSPAISPVGLTGISAPEARDDAQWFAEEVHPHDGQLKAYLRRTYPAVRDVEDVVQESYLRIWRRHAIKPVSSVKNFLFSVARHLVVDLMRREGVSPIKPVTDFPVLSVMDDNAGAADVACTNEEVAMLLEAIDALPSRCREIMILRKLEGIPQKEIAQRLGLSVQTVQVQVGRGTRRCENFMRARGVIPETER